jgi:hypothetical protein
MREAFFHEDDYCQIEVLPLDNLSFCLEQAGQIDEFSEEHRVGSFWDAMYIRAENPAKLASLRLTLSQIRDALVAEMPEFDSVLTGYSSYREPCPKVHGFGRDDSEVLFVEAADDQIVTAIWCSDPMPELQRLPRREHLLLADWGWSFICPLADTERFNIYLSERERVFRNLAEKWEAERQARGEVARPEEKKRWWKFW